MSSAAEMRGSIRYEDDRVTQVDTTFVEVPARVMTWVTRSSLATFADGSEVIGYLVPACSLPSMDKKRLSHPAVKRYVVSASGQMSLPAEARHRWGLDGGGPVDVVDLGFGILTVPEGQGKRLFRDLLSRDEQAQYVAALDDPDLATT
jgi:bifunctional DNA-binding transcriptional regulator/antitoxin component of YhaV-PrlF toxin-antitoxin module